MLAQLEAALIAGTPESVHRVLTHARAAGQDAALQRLLRATPALIARVADVTRHSYTFLTEVMDCLTPDQATELRVLRRHDPALAIFPGVESEFTKAALDIFNPASSEEEQAHAVSQCTKMVQTDPVYFAVLALELGAADQVRIIELVERVFDSGPRYSRLLTDDLAIEGDVILMDRLYLAVLNDAMLRPLVLLGAITPPTRTAMVLARGSASVAAELSSRALFCLGSRGHTGVTDMLHSVRLLEQLMTRLPAPVREHVERLKEKVDANLGQLDLQAPTYIEFLRDTLPKEAKALIIRNYFAKSADILQHMGSHRFGEGLRLLDRRDRLARVLGVTSAELCTTTEEVFYETVMRVIVQARANPDQGYFPRDDLTQAALDAAADLRTLQRSYIATNAMMEAKVGTIDPDLVAAVIKLNTKPSYQANFVGFQLRTVGREDRDDTLEYVYHVSDPLVGTTAAGGLDTSVARALVNGFGVTPEELAAAEQRWRRERWGFVAAVARAPKRLPLPPAGGR